MLFAIPCTTTGVVDDDVKGKKMTKKCWGWHGIVSVGWYIDTPMYEVTADNNDEIVSLNVSVHVVAVCMCLKGRWA